MTLQQALDPVQTVESDLLSALSKSEQRQFRALLAKVALDPIVVTSPGPGGS
jgi:hypothetical protein